MTRGSVRLKRAAALSALIALLALSNAPSATSRGTLRPSGGLGVVYRDGHRIEAARLPRAETRSITHTAIEPTMGLSPGGDIFVAASGWGGAAGGAQTEIMRSEDGGKTWTNSSPRFLDADAQPVSLDPYVFVDDVDGDNARIFTIDLTVACSYMSFSDDGGETWTTNPLSCGRPVNDHQSLFGGPPATSATVDYPHVMYYCWNDVGTSSCTKSLDGGVTFTLTGEPAFYGTDPNNSESVRHNDGDDVCGGIHGHGVVGDDGTVFLPRDYCDKPFLAISRNEGLTWERVRIAGPKYDVAEFPNGRTADPSVAVDKRGNIYYTWARAKDRLPYLSISKDGGKTWSKPKLVSPPGINEANFATLTVGKPGSVAFAYYGTKNSPWPRCRTQWCNLDEWDKTTWNGYLTVTTNGLDPNPTFRTAAINPQRDPLVKEWCGPGRCAMVYDFIDVAIGNDGLAYGVFVDGCMSDCEVWDDEQFLGDNGSEFEGVVAKLLGAPPLK